MRKLFRCICSSSARDLPVALEGNMKIKQQRARARESAHLSRSPTSYLPRGISPTATSAWTDACLPACLAVLESSVWEKRSEIQEVSAGRGSARALNVVLYILFIYIADLSVNYVSVCVCVCLFLSVCVCMRTRNCVCVCVPIGGSISWLHCRNAAIWKSFSKSAKVIFICTYSL